MSQLSLFALALLAYAVPTSITAWIAPRIRGRGRKHIAAIWRWASNFTRKSDPHVRAAGARRRRG